ncbi:excisionase [Erwinia phage vB_EhrS_59]|uniref:Excisionase n=1 Tax=Erwinia phage vB_EhrS_59 TaxID=2283025 RepID=A0A4Y1NRD8_9CAUD|nr:excisionase [Erwinia phage vB_EhrS_59]AXH43544.1 excisionase [Erwinia phage vB_EhrS_59]
MTDFRMDDVLFNLCDAASFLRKSPRTVRQLIKDRKLRAGKSGSNGGGRLEILKSSCLEYIHNQQQNQAVNAENGHSERKAVWRSNNVTEIGTVTSSNRVAKELGAALIRQTGSKRRNSMTG